MLRIATITVHSQSHPLEESLHHQLTEHGYSLDDVETANVVICMGQDIQGFDAASLQQLETQITERFLGAELFLLALYIGGGWLVLRCDILVSDYVTLVAAFTSLRTALSGVMQALVKFPHGYVSILRIGEIFNMENDDENQERWILFFIFSRLSNQKFKFYLRNYYQSK